MLKLQGTVEIQGSPTELYDSGVDFVKLVGLVEPQQDNEDQEMPYRRKSAISTRSRSSALNNSDSENEDENIEIDYGVQIEDSSKGKIKGSISMNYFKAGANTLTISVLLFSFLFVQFLASTADYWVSIWYDLCVCIINV